MALGTALTAAFTVSTTASTHNTPLATDGVTALQSTFDAGGKLTVCLMSYWHDYEGNEPPDGGNYTRVSTYYSEYTGTGRDPQLKWVWSGGGTGDVYSEGSGNDDDTYLAYYNLDDSLTWAQMRGDETTSGLGRNDSRTYYGSGVNARRFSGRGSVIRDISRSYFVFNLSGESGTVASCNIEFYLDNFGTSTGDSAKIIAVQATALAGTTADWGNCFVADTVTPSQNATFFGANF